MAKQIRKLTVAMIGYGFMGRAHSNAFSQVGDFFDLPYELRLKTICGRNRAAVEAMAGQWGWEEAQTDWQSVVVRKDIDVVDICAPNHLHAPIAMAAAEAGKIVLCEKPLAMNVAEAKQMAETTTRIRNLLHRWFHRLEEQTQLNLGICLGCRATRTSMVDHRVLAGSSLVCWKALESE